jgi:hypothetical protein
MSKMDRKEAIELRRRINAAQNRLDFGLLGMASRHWSMTRGMGHTRILVQGMAEFIRARPDIRLFLGAASMQQGSDLLSKIADASGRSRSREVPVYLLTPDNPQALYGVSGPLALDHYVIQHELTEIGRLLSGDGQRTAY